MTPPIFTGSGVALLTLFDDDGRMLADYTAALAASLFAEGIRAFLVAGTAGEFFSLDDEERVKLTARVRGVLPASATVLAHVGGVPAERAEVMTRAAIDVGADAVVALPLGVEDLHEYYARIVSAAAATPVVAYHLPQAGASIPVGLLPELGVRATKDSEGDIRRLEDELERGLEIYTGAPNTLLRMHHRGAPGTLVGLANSHPATTIAAFSGDEAAQELLLELEPQSLKHFPTNLKLMTAARFPIPTGSRQRVGT